MRERLKGAGMVLTEHTETMMKSDTLRLDVDREHGGIRLAVFLIFFVALVVGYIAVNLILPIDGVNLVGVILAFAIAAVTTQYLERVLKRRWPSGRRLEITPDTIRMSKQNQVEVELDPTKQVNILAWRFTIRRGGARAKRGWYVVAFALEQDGILLPAYTFVSPEDFESLPLSSQFERLMSKKEIQGTSQDRDMRLAGQQRRLHNAENERWTHGAELSREDFSVYLRHLQQHFPKWMPVR